LAGMLGLHTDRTRHYPSFRVYLGETSLDDFRRQWLEYYEHKNFDDFITSTGHDKSGNYIDFKSALIELRDLDGIIRVSGWSWDNPELRSMREFRALAVFQAWVQNSDLKNENNKLVIREGKVPSVFFMVHDLGVTFGKYMAEAVLSYEENPVASVSDDQISLRFNPNTDLSFVTYSDARWMLRRIAQLSREQITEAVNLGYWNNQKPHDVRGLLIERLIQRRNHLLRAFDLIGAPDGAGALIQEMPVQINSTVGVKPLPKSKVDVEDYGPEFSQRVFKPLMRDLSRAVWDLGETIVGAIGSARLDPSWLGIDSSIISEIIISRDRHFVRNPEPATSEDTYIVKDDYRIGFRLGGGFVLTGDVAYVREHTVLFTARDEDQARFAPGTRVGLTESYEDVAKRLPKNHLYLRSDFLEGRGRLKYQPLDMISPQITQSFSRVQLWRGAVIAKQGAPVQAFVDRERGYVGALGLYTNLFLWRVPHAGITAGNFKTTRKIYDLTSLAPAVRMRASNAVLFFGDIEAVASLKAAQLEAVSRQEKENYWSLLGLIDGQNKRVTENLQVFRLLPDGQAVSLGNVFKHKRESSQGWKFFTDGETFKRSFLYQSRKDHGATTSEDFLDARVLIRDNSVKTRELSQQYLQIVDMISGQENFLGFTPELHQGNSNNWGSLDVVIRSSYSKGALEQVSSLKTGDLLSGFSNLTGIPVNALVSYMRELSQPHSFSAGKGAPRISRPPWYFRSARVLGRSAPLGDSLEKIRDFSRQLSKIRTLQDPSAAGARTLDALFENSSGGLGFANPIIFTLIHSHIKENDRYFSVYVSPQQFTENKLPAGLVLTRRDGKFSSAASEEVSVYNFEDALRVYHAFFSDKDRFHPIPDREVIQ
ncbi:MAG: hypothetical protein KGQ59_03465, partial [Bdellovibrionales bacterium]|nr:hypothetical protein [Bdellovibrionales bacterium]